MIQSLYVFHTLWCQIIRLTKKNKFEGWHNDNTNSGKTVKMFVHSMSFKFPRTIEKAVKENRNIKKSTTEKFKNTNMTQPCVLVLYILFYVE